MYNILICDDEQIVLESLTFIFNKNFEGEVNVFKCQSGPEAIATVTRESIDIIFMDINMPGMSGLDTLKCIANLKPDVVSIVLSAFDKFQYAQEAMNLGAFKYITKPVNRNMVIQTVRNAMNLVDEKRGRETNGVELQKKLGIVSPIIESDFIYSCIFNPGCKDELSTYLEYLEISAKNYFFMCLELPKFDSGKNVETAAKIRSIISEKYSFIMGSFMSNRIVIFLSVDGDDVAETAMETAKEIYTLISLNISQGIRAGVSMVSGSLDEISANYNSAVSALNSTSPNGEILFSSEMQSDGSDSEKIEKINRRIFARMKIGDAAGVKFLADLFCTEISRQNLFLDKTKNHVFELLVNGKNLVRENGGDMDTVNFEDTFSILSSLQDIQGISNFTGTMLCDFTTAIIHQKEKKENPLIRKVTDFINGNISRNISLEDAAAEAGVSSFYLSKLFKEETGETFINFVTDTRLEKAKSLLSGTELSVKEITAECGYNDQNYFSRLFKTKFGVSPTDFRGK